MIRAQMIEKFIQCQTENHQTQEAFVYVLDDDFNPNQRLLCQRCFNQQTNPLVTINPKHTQRRIQQQLDLVYENVKSIVDWIKESNKDLSIQIPVSLVLQELIQNYEKDLSRIERNNCSYSFNEEIEIIKSCLFQTKVFDQVFEKFYIKKITQMNEKIQNCQQNYIHLLYELLSQDENKGKNFLQTACSETILKDEVQEQTRIWLKANVVQECNKNIDVFLIQTNLMAKIIQNQNQIKECYQRLMQKNNEQY